VKVHLHEFEKPIPVGRNRPVPSRMHERAESMQDGFAGSRPSIRAESILAEQLVNGSRCHGREELTI